MSLHVHCDGPGCEKTARPAPDPDAAPPSNWFRLSHTSPPTRDFHDLRCLRDWLYITLEPDAGK